MKLFTEETRVVYSDAFPHALAITAIGNTNLAGVRVHTILRAPSLPTKKDEARRALRLTRWLARFGSVLPQAVGAGEFGPFPFPFPMPLPAPWLTAEEAARVAVDAAGAPEGEMGRAMERALRGPFRHRMHFEPDPLLANDPELEKALHDLKFMVACSPLREVTLGQVLDGLKDLFVVRRLGAGALEATTAVVGINHMIHGELMLMLQTVLAGSAATILLRVLRPVETFSDAYAREIAASSKAPALPDDTLPQPQLPDSGEGRSGRRRRKGSTEAGEGS